MSQFRKQNAGFTLIELVVAMAVAVIVTAAATSVLLFGLRVNRQSADTASRQMTVRALLNVVEKAAADGNIKDIKSDYESWELLDRAIDKTSTSNAYRVIFGFDSESQTIYTGREYDENGEEKTKGTIVLEGVYASNAIIEGKLLSVSVETKEGIFTSSIYCRIVDLKDNSDSNELPGVTGEDPRGKFIGILKSQYRSRGEIRVDGKDTGEYFSEWYIGLDYDDEVYDNGWNAKTPWCACYISWALDKAGMTSTIEGHPRWFANVDDFMAYFQNDSWKPSAANGGDYAPEPGDLIFFDWNKGTNPQHVGVVLEVKNNGGATIIYTIEGNSSGRVAIRNYSINDERIIGYGVIFPN